MHMKNILIVLIVLVVLGGGYFVMTAIKLPAENIVPVISPPGVKETVVTTELTGKPEAIIVKGSVKEFTVEGRPFEFSLKEMRVNKGDTVTVTFVNQEGMHDWVVDEFNARTKQIKTGETDTVTFVADQTGMFEYYCSVGQHRANGMVGKLIVE